MHLVVDVFVPLMIGIVVGVYVFKLELRLHKLERFKEGFEE